MSKNIITRSIPTNGSEVRMNFEKSSFSTLIYNNGYEVFWERAVECPCKSKGSGYQSNCKNCGGSGWIFLNKIKTRMILHSMNLEKRYQEFGVQGIGTVSVSSMDDDKIAYMDRITVIEGETYHNQILYPVLYNNRLFSYTIYDIKEIEYIGRFISETTPLQRLTIGSDFTFERNVITLDDKFIGTNNLSLTILYKHSPQFHVIDIGRDVMTIKVPIGGIEKTVQMPVRGLARRSHYVFDAQNLTADRIFDNSYLI